jgi:hypothetical protein
MSKDAKYRIPLTNIEAFGGHLSGDAVYVRDPVGYCNQWIRAGTVEPGESTFPLASLYQAIYNRGVEIGRSQLADDLRSLLRIPKSNG